MSRHLKHFPLTPEVSLFPDDKGTHYILEIVAGDRPGLLARIAYTLAAANVNGATEAIAGVLSEKLNVLGLMPHPENHVEPVMGSTDGRGLFAGLVAHFAQAA